MDQLLQKKGNDPFSAAFHKKQCHKWVPCFQRQATPGLGKPREADVKANNESHH